MRAAENLGRFSQTIKPSWHASEPSAAFTCMSSGVERLLKLTYCLALVHEGRTFPSDKDLRALGHDLVALDNVVRPLLLNGARSLAKDYVVTSLTELDEDAYWPDLLTALNVWAGSAGRYRDLSILTSQPAAGDSADAVWQVAELRCVIDLGLLAALAGPDSRAALVQARTRLALSVLKWWHAISCCWTHRLLGPEQVPYGSVLSPAGNSRLSATLASLAKAL